MKKISLQELIANLIAIYNKNRLIVKELVFKSSIIQVGKSARYEIGYDLLHNW